MIEGIKRIRKAFKRITERLKKTDATFNTPADQNRYLTEKLEDREKEVIFADGEHPVVLPGMITQKEGTGNGWLVYGIRGKTLPKVIEVVICKDKRKARKQKKKLHNDGNNKRKLKGQPLKRFIAKQKIRKKRVSDSDTTQ